MPDPETTEPQTEAPAEKVQDPEKVLELARKKDRENLSMKAKLKEQDSELSRLRKIEESQQTDFDKALAKAVKETRATVEGEHRSAILTERVLARAAGRLADPTDSALIDLTGLDPDDLEGIDAAIESLLESKPHLASATEKAKSKQPKGKIDQGQQGKIIGSKDASADDWLRGQFDNAR